MPIAVLKKAYARDALPKEVAAALAAAPHPAESVDGHARTARKPFFWRNSSILFSSIAINCLSLALPLAMLQVFERIIPNAALDTFAYLMLGLICVVVLDGCLRILRSYAVAWQGSRFEHAVSCEAVKRLTETSLEEFDRAPAGRHLERLQSIETLRDFYGGSALINLLEVPFLFIFIAMVALIGGELVFVPVALFLVAAGLAYLIGKRLKSRIGKRNQLDMQRFNFILEVLNAIQHVKSQALEGFMQRRYERLQAACAFENSQMARLAATAHGMGAFFSYFVLFATAASGAYMVVAGALSQGELAACSLLAGRATQPFLRSLAFWSEHQSVSVAKHDLALLLDHASENPAGDAGVVEASGAITFENVGIAFGDNTVLANVNFQVEPGEAVLIDGAMGGGKSTILKLACGITQPTSGAVKIGGVDLASMAPSDIRRQVAYLPEKAVMFRGTILDNLTLFDHEQNLDRAMEVVAKLGLDRMFAQMPDGLETEIGDDLAELMPLGVRQQIGIVRALAQNPKIVLFDQPNGGLDMDADQRLVELLQSMKGDVTLLMATPRGAYRRMADRVAIIGKDGAVRQAGLPTAVRERVRAASPGLRIKSAKPEGEPGNVSAGVPMGKSA